MKDVLGDQINAHRTVVLHPRERTPVCLETARETLDINRRGELHDRARIERVRIVERESRCVHRRLVEAAAGVFGAHRTALVTEPRLAQIQQCDDLRVVRFDLVGGLAKAGAGVEVELGGHCGRKICPEVHLLLLPRVQHGVRDGRVQHVLVIVDVALRHLNGPELIVEIRAGEKAQPLTATAHVHAEQTAAAKMNERCRRIAQVVIPGQAVRGAGGTLRRRERRRLHHGELAPRDLPGGQRLAEVGKLFLIVIAVADRPRFTRVGPTRGTGPPPLCGDDDDTVCRVGAVQRCRRRALHDFDILDLFGTQVVQHAQWRGAGRVGGTRRIRGAGAGVVPHTIDNPDGRIVERDGRHATHANVWRAPHHRTGKQNHARRLGHQEIGDVRDRRFFNALVHVAKCRDCVAEFHLALLASGRGHDFRQLNDGHRDREIDFHAAAIRHHRHLLLRSVTHAQYLHVHRTRAHVAQHVLAIVARDGG